MKKGQKIKRYGNIYSTSGSNSPIIVLAMVAGLAIFSLIGWSLYPLAYDFVSNFDLNPPSNSQPQPPAVAAPSEGTPVASQPSEGATVPSQSNTLQTGIYVPSNLISDTAAFDALLVSAKQAEASYIMVDAKDVQGTLLYSSSNPIALRSLAVSPTAYDAKVIAKRIKDAGFIPVARVHAFRDNIAARANREMAVTYYDTTYAWLDNAAELGGRAWLNPYSAEVQGYIIDIALELSDAGFSQIMLDSATFPVGVGLDKAGYGTNITTPQNQVIANFVTQLETKLSEKKTGTMLHLSDELLFREDYIATPSQYAVATASVETLEDEQKLKSTITTLRSRVAQNGKIGVLVSSVRQDGSAVTTEELGQLKQKVANEGASLCLFYNVEGSYSLQ